MTPHRVLRGSVLVARLRTGWQRSRQVVVQSRLVAVLATIVARLAFWRQDDGKGEEQGQSPALTNSRLVGGFSAAGTRLGDAGRQSWLAGLAGIGRRYVEGSWLYRWLTAEPEQDVIVIDLRETVTVGPWLRAIQRGITWLLPAALSSALFRTARRAHRVFTNRPIQAASIGLAVLALLILAVALQLGGPSTTLLALGILLGVLALVGSRITWTYADLRETRGYQLLASAFEPPKPPEQAMQDESERENEREE